MVKWWLKWLDDEETEHFDVCKIQKESKYFHILYINLKYSEDLLEKHNNYLGYWWLVIPTLQKNEKQLDLQLV